MMPGILYFMNLTDGDLYMEILEGSAVQDVPESMRSDPNFDAGTEHVIHYNSPFEHMCRKADVMLRYPRFNPTNIGGVHSEGGFCRHSRSYPPNESERIIKMFDALARSMSGL